MISRKAITGLGFSLSLALAVGVVTSQSAGAQTGSAGDMPTRAQLETLLEQVNVLIAQNDTRLAELDDKIAATTDTAQQERLEAVVVEWTRTLDGLETQRLALVKLLDVLPAESNDDTNKPASN